MRLNPICPVFALELYGSLLEYINVRLLDFWVATGNVNTYALVPVYRELVSMVDFRIRMMHVIRVLLFLTNASRPVSKLLRVKWSKLPNSVKPCSLSALVNRNEVPVLRGACDPMLWAMRPPCEVYNCRLTTASIVGREAHCGHANNKLCMDMVVGGCIQPARPLQVNGYMFTEPVLSSGIEYQSPTYIHCSSI